MDSYNLEQLKQALAIAGDAKFETPLSIFERIHNSYLSWLNTPDLTIEEKQNGATMYAQAATSINQ